VTLLNSKEDGNWKNLKKTRKKKTGLIEDETMRMKELMKKGSSDNKEGENDEDEE